MPKRGERKEKSVLLQTLVRTLPDSQNAECLFCTYMDKEGKVHHVSYYAYNAYKRVDGTTSLTFAPQKVLNHFEGGHCTEEGIAHYKKIVALVDFNEDAPGHSVRKPRKVAKFGDFEEMDEDIVASPELTTESDSDDSADLFECACGENFQDNFTGKAKYIGHVRKCIAYSSWHANFLKLELVGGPLLPGVSEVKFHNGKPVFKSAAVLYVHVKPTALITLPKYFIADCLAYFGIVKIYTGLTMEASFIKRQNDHEQLNRLSLGSDLVFGILEGSAEDINFIEMVCHVTPKPLSNSGDHSNYSKYLTGRSEDEIKAAYNTVINALRTLFFKLKDEEIKAGRMRSNLETKLEILKSSKIEHENTLSELN